jgi:hypothetical protein
MRPDVFELIGYGSLVLLMLYMAFYVWRARRMPKTRAGSQTSIDDNTAAIRENSELLRELIAINRKLLDSKERPDA